MSTTTLYRYFYYVGSTLKPLSMTAWKAAGEPNPFWPKPKRRAKSTNQQEIRDIFEDHGVGWD